LGTIVLVIHERQAQWARQLRPRLASWRVRIVETRTAADLETALRGLACPIVVIDLGQRPLAGLEALDRVVRVAPDALILVLDPAANQEVAVVARALGATHVLEGHALPPAIVSLLERWLPLAQQHAIDSGWSRAPDSPQFAEPWAVLASVLGNSTEVLSRARPKSTAAETTAPI
jgi:ActR/RegA family two-component response regulator